MQRLSSARMLHREVLFPSELLHDSAGQVVLHYIVNYDGDICSPQLLLHIDYWWNMQVLDLLPVIWSPFNLYICVVST